MIKLITPLTQLDSSAKFTVGSKTITKDGNEYIYLPGVASVVKYDWVTYRTGAGPGSYGSVTRLVQNTSGAVAIAQAAIVSNKWGWFQIAGTGWGLTSSTFSSGSALYASGTTGAVDSAVVDRNEILHSLALGTSSGVASGTVLAWIDHPSIHSVK